MSRFIQLHPSVMRCRAEPPLTKLHNDCGKQDACARRVAANTTGAPQRDLSVWANTVYGQLMNCPFYLSFGDAPAFVERGTKSFPVEPAP